MQRKEVRVCILRVGGTNCDAETQRALTEMGVAAEIIHLNELARKANLLHYDALVIPGGFSYGDYVRAGAVLAKRVLSKLDSPLRQFIKEQRPVLGICNGFQVLVEAGLLPGFDGFSHLPQAALANNVPIGYRCMWVHVKHVNKGRCIFTRSLDREVLRMPIAHAEGRFVLSKEKEDEHLRRLYENDQIVFRYCTTLGEFAEGKYAANPNGAFHDIAGICDSTGTVFGLMPHPERAYYRWQLPDWTRETMDSDYGDGKPIFDSMVEYLLRKL